MNARGRRHAGRLVDWACALALLGAGYAFVRLLAPLPPWNPPQLATPERDVHSADELRPLSESELAVIWQRDLRQSVVDAPPPRVTPPEAPKLAVQLIGTVIEPQRRFGLFVTGRNQTIVKRVGERVDGFEVVAIERGQATLRQGQREYTLKAPCYDQIARRDEP